MGDRALDYPLALRVQLLHVRSVLSARLIAREPDQTGKLGGLTDLLLAEQAVLCEVALQS